MIENGIRELSARYPEVIFGFADISYIDLGILLASALALLTSCFIGKKNSLDRLDGVLFLILWAGYMAWLIVNL